jgi:hypothetical protein
LPSTPRSPNGLFHPGFPTESVYTFSISLMRVTPSVVVEWLILFPRIRKVPGSNLSPETDYPDGRFFMVFLSSSRQMPI